MSAPNVDIFHCMNRLFDLLVLLGSIRVKGSPVHPVLFIHFSGRQTDQCFNHYHSYAANRAKN